MLTQSAKPAVNNIHINYKPISTSQGLEVRKRSASGSENVHFLTRSLCFLTLQVRLEKSKGGYKNYSPIPGRRALQALLKTNENVEDETNNLMNSLISLRSAAVAGSSSSFS